jgi:hypothetical protein
VIVVASGKEEKDASVGAENQSNLQADAALEVISAQPPNTKTRMKMW